MCVWTFELFLLELPCRTKKEEEEPHYSKHTQQHVPPGLCSEPVIEIWVLIRSLSLWHLIHPFAAWYNLPLVWHCVTGKSWQIVSAKCQFSHCQENRRGETEGVRVAFTFRVRWRPYCVCVCVCLFLLRWGGSKTPKLVDINNTACKAHLGFSKVNVWSDPLLANGFWAVWGDANLQRLTADLSRCWSATQWPNHLLQFNSDSIEQIS